MPASKTFLAQIEQHPENASMYFEVPFDPKEAFGKVRAPVKVTLGGYTFATTIARMGGKTFVGLNAEVRAATEVKAGARVKVVVAADEAERRVSVPDELAAALAKNKRARAAWEKLSYTHQREHAEAITGAKKPETRARRVAKAIEMLTSS